MSFKIRKMLHSLPTDIQRLICDFLTYREIVRISPRFIENDNDIYWKMKYLAIADEEKPKDMTHRKFYESCVYAEYLEPRFNDEKLFHETIEKDTLFLKKYIDVKVKGEKWTALIYAAFHSDIPSVKKLLDYGANPNIQSPRGWTALMHTVITGDSVEVFLSYDVDLNLQNNLGQTALILSVIYRMVDCVRLLLNAGADFTLRDHEEHTALSHAILIKNQKIIDMLLAAGAKD
jgi:hypothetical protein